MNKPILKSLAAFCLFILIISSLSSCKKEDTKDFIEQAKIAAEYFSAEDDFTDLFFLFHKALCDTALENNGSAVIDSAFVTYKNDSVEGISYTFDYGDEDIICPDGKTRKGMIDAVLSKNFSLQDATFNAAFQNFKVDNILLRGDYNYKNEGLGQGGKKMYSLTFHGTYQKETGKILTLETDRTVLWEEGYDTPEKFSDDVFSMTGDADGMSYGGNDFECEIISNWILQTSCLHPFKEGESEIVVLWNEENYFLFGEFIDVDQDGCADKVMIFDPDGEFGYPFYL